MKTFRQFLEKKLKQSGPHDLILNEGFMNLPYMVYRNIAHFIIREIGDFQLTGRAMRPKIFSLDLRGTSYEFLQELNPKVKITVHPEDIEKDSYGTSIRNTPPGHAVYGEFRGISVRKNHVLGDIHMRGDPLVVYTTLEHEILHFIQDLIKHRLNIRYAAAGRPISPKIPPVLAPYARRRKIRRGGLPNKKILIPMLRKTNVDGFIEPDDPTQPMIPVEYADRPIEQMAILNTMVNEIRTLFLMQIIRDMGIKPHKIRLEELLRNTEFAERMADKKSKKELVDREYGEELLKADVQKRRFFASEIHKRFIDSEDWVGDVFDKIGDMMAYEDEIRIRRRSPELLKIWPRLPKIRRK